MFFSMILLLWAGMILGISCLEAWVKFKTPTLIKPVGLDVGRTVFRAFHKVQWGWLIALILVLLFIQHPKIYFIVPIALGLLLYIQTNWLFPILCANVDLILANDKPNNLHYHAFYAVLEMIKLLLLIGGSVYFMAV